MLVWAVFKTPSLFHYTGWLIKIPKDCYYLMMGSIIPQLIINQQGFRSHCSIRLNERKPIVSHRFPSSKTTREVQVVDVKPHPDPQSPVLMRGIFLQTTAPTRLRNTEPIARAQELVSGNSDSLSLCYKYCARIT